MIQSNWYNEYIKLYEKLSNENLVLFYGKYNHKNLDTILKDINLAIHKI